MTVDVLLVERAVERLLVVAFGGTSLVLGWALFMKGVIQEQVAQLEIMSWKVRLQKVGPGVFFALFGTAILVSSLATRLEVGNVQPPALASVQRSSIAPTDSAQSLRYMGNGADDLRMAHAINSVLKVHPEETQLPPADQIDLRRALGVLKDARDAMTVRALGDRQIIPFFVANRGDPNFAQNSADHDRLEKAVPWLHETMSFEPPDGNSLDQ